MEKYSPRDEYFPAGLRVLVVDDDPTWLKILEKMLRKCSYEVTTCSLARVALDMLRERKNMFDIVISDVNMPDMDGFKLLELVGLEMDLPVIMMSVDGETSRVMKGVQHGACDYLLKPVRMKELRNIWQHVFRKKINEVREAEIYEGHEGNNNSSRGRSDEFDEKIVFNGGGLHPSKKRKEIEQNFSDSSASTKKARVVWSVDLHQKFVNAVNQIGFDKVGPKKILDLMDIPGLTRENVASHLQKYRLYLGRLQKQNEERSQTAAKDPSAGLTQKIDSNAGCGFASARIHHAHDVILPKIPSLGASETGPALTATQLTQFMKAGQDIQFDGDTVEMQRFDSMGSKHMVLWKCSVDQGNSQANQATSVNVRPFEAGSLSVCGDSSSWSTLTSSTAVAVGAPMESSVDHLLESFFYDELQYNCECLTDLFQPPPVDDGLFT